MYHFLVQSLIGLVGSQWSQVRIPASARNFFVHLQNQRRPPFVFSRLCETEPGFSKSPKEPPYTIFVIVRRRKKKNINFPNSAGWTLSKQFCFSKSAPPFRILSALSGFSKFVFFVLKLGSLSCPARFPRENIQVFSK